MHWLSLPEPRRNIAQAFQDAKSARSWLSEQPRAQALNMLIAVDLQVEAIDGDGLPPATAIELLDLLRSAAVPAYSNIESRFIRKALPMLDEDQRSFDIARQFWLHLGVAYLRLAQKLPPGEQMLPLNRAASSLRIAQYAHFQAACECPQLLDQLLFGILAQAAASGVLTQPLADPDFPHLGDANIAGHLAWAFLLRLSDPYKMSASQLVVAHRAFSRWRELAAFLEAADPDPKAHVIDLSPLFGQPLPPGIPGWINVRSVIRKIRQRIEALKAGESPEALKLGRELSATACIRLLRELDDSLRERRGQPSTEVGEIELAFGGDHAYAVLKGKYLNKPVAPETRSTAIAHQRMAIFGFDSHSQMPGAVKKIDIPLETWTLLDGKALRPLEPEGGRRLSPCLVAAVRHGKKSLGVLFGLQTTQAGTLSGSLRWYDGRIEAGWLKSRTIQGPNTPRTAAFLRHEGDALSLILPATAPVRLDMELGLEDLSVETLVPTEVLERGVDYVRYACRPA